MAPTNRDIAAAFATVAGMIELQDGPVGQYLRYMRASHAILNLPRELHIIVSDGKLAHYRSIRAIADPITEFLSTGSFPLYDQLVAQIPPDLVQVMRLEGIGARKARLLWREHGIVDLAGLESALKNGQLTPLVDLEPDRLRESIKRQTQGPVPWLLGKAHPAAHDLLRSVLRQRQVVEGAVVGSIRRRCPMVKDINLLVAVEEQSHISQVIWDFANRANFMPVGRRGRTDITVELRGGYQIDLQVITRDNWGAALCHYTGSPAHTARLRQRASDRGLRFDEGGLTRVAGAEIGPIPCDTEEAFYEALGLPWIPPELREDAGEIEAAAAGTLPHLIALEDMQGDLHMHTRDSDGKRPAREMVEEARQRGHKYIAITDHSRSLVNSNGLEIDRLMQQQDEVRRIDAEMNGSIRVLHGVEMDILPDGRLDYPDEVLEKLDLVIASLHVGLQQDRDTTTHRLLNAIQNPHVDLIGHPRSFWRAFQQPVEADMDAVLAAARQHDTALEINANPERLDLDGPLARRATEMGIKLAIDTDAHYPAMLDILEYGVFTARRGWVQADSVLNTWPLDRLRRWLQTRDL